jgi:hypothetical protein
MSHGWLRLMNKKFLLIFLIGLLSFSSVSLALADVQCPKCDGTGQLVCSSCQGTGTVVSEGTTICGHCQGSGLLTPSVSKTAISAFQGNGVTSVTGTFNNKETVDIVGTVTASLAGHSNSTSVTFPAGQVTSVTVVIPYVGSYTQMQLMTRVQLSLSGIEDILCPYCNGAGTVSGAISCLDCGGTGYIKCPTCDGTGTVSEAVEVTSGAGSSLVAAEAAVAVIVVIVVVVGAFLVLKKRRISEEKLRRFSSSQLNNWVLARLDGKAASSRDTAMGIDGYTGRGQPVQIKQSDDVGMIMIESFAAALARNKARNGVIVGYSFGSDAVRGKIRAQMNYKLQIEMLTIKELIESKRTL